MDRVNRDIKNLVYTICEMGCDWYHLMVDYEVSSVYHSVNDSKVVVDESCE